MKNKFLVVCVLVLIMSVFAGCGKTDEDANAEESKNVSME